MRPFHKPTATAVRANRAPCILGSTKSRPFALTLCDSATQSKRMRFSIHTGPVSPAKSATIGKLGQRDFQIRTEASELGQYRGGPYRALGFWRTVVDAENVLAV